MMAKKSQILAFSFIILIVLSIILLRWTAEIPVVSKEMQTQSPCANNGIYPNFNCTSGKNITISLEELCKVGYTKTVRKVTAKVRAEILKKYNISAGYGRDFELDHLIPLELGGSNDAENLWVEPSHTEDFRLGYQEKDKIENLLHKKVCNGEITLEQAQYDIVYNWTKWL